MELGSKSDVEVAEKGDGDVADSIKGSGNMVMILGNLMAGMTR